MDTRRRRALIESFEPRIMYSADPGPAGLAAAVLTAAELQVDGGEALQGAGIELVFVDARVPELQLLLDDLAAQQQAGRAIEVVVIGGGDDGIAVVGESLAGRDDVTAIHLIGHGAAGVAELGASRLDAGSLALRAGEIAAWGDALTAEADLLIYGCEVASTPAGESLVEALAALTGADVAASDGLTGAAGLGGDWELEYRSGGIETTLAPGVAVQQAWGGVLAISTSGAVTSASSADANSLTWSHTVASGTDVALFVEIAMRNSGTHAQTVKYGVQDLTWVGDLNSNQGVVEIWRLLSPTPGTANVVVSLSANTAVAAGATTYNGVNQSSPVRNFYSASGTGITGSVTVSDSAVGDLVIDIQSWRGEPTGSTLGEKQLENWSQVVAGSNGLTSKSTRESGDVSVVMSGSYTSSADWVIGAVAIRPSALNSAPVLNASKSPTLTTIAEDAGAPSGAVGTLVSSLVDFASPAGQVDNVTDADPGARTGIAVTATNTSAGSWWYSLNNGGNWLAMGSVSEASARLLSADAGTRLYFQSNANWNGSLADAITFRAWDRSNGANGDLASAASTGGISAFSSVSDTASLTVSAVNDAPVMTFVSGNANYPENAGPVIVAPAATVSDVDSTDFAGGRLEVYFSADGQPEDRIGIRNEGTGAGQIGLSGSDVTYGGVVIGSWSGGTSGTTPLIVSFNPNATAVSAQALGRNITYQNVSDTPSTQVRTLVGYLVDGDGGTSNIVGGTLTIVPANDAPVAVITPASYTATEQVALALSGTGISVSDADAGTAVIHATLSVVSGTLSGVEGSTGVTLAGSGTSSVTLDGTLAQINAFLAGNAGASLSYRIDTDVPPASDTFTLTVDDLGSSGGPAQTGTDTATINITAVNDGPANHIPGVQVTALDTAVIMRAADGNGLSITDPDAGSALIRVALSATSGKLTLGTTAGLATVSGDGTASVIVTGTLAVINTALDGLRFTPTGGFTGTASFVVETSDQGNTGGGALTDTDTVFIKVGASRFQQGVDGYSGTEDTYVSDGASTTSYGNATTVVTDDGSPLNQGLLRFGNLFGSGVGQIPLGAVINSVTLSFYVTHTDANDSVSIYRMLSAWDESSTWSGLGSGVSLNGSEAASSPDVANWDSGISGWNTITSGLKASVQAWANGETNNGWVFNSLSPAADNWTFASSEYATVSQRPYLVISYTPPAPPVITSNGGGATASVVMAENGTYVTTVTATDADSAQGALRYFIAGADSDKFSIDSSGVLSFKVAPDYEAPSDVGSNRVYDLTVRVSDGSVEDTQDIAVTVTAVNEAPAFTGLGGSVSHTEGGPATVLTGAATLSDPELSAANSFGGATLTLARSGGANAEDVFSATGQLAPLTAGESLLLDGVAVGTVNVKAGGTLSLSFNANATPARINEVLQSIAYTNTSNTPPASVEIGWTFNDGNAGGQGTGGALSAAGVKTVNITEVNDPAVIGGDDAASLTETDAVESTGGTLTVSDVDSPASFVAQSGAAGNNGYGSFSLGTDGVWTYTMSSAHDAFAAGSTYTDSFTARTADGTTQQVTVTITGTNDAPTVATSIADQSATEDAAFSFTLPPGTFTDVDASDSLSYTTSALPGWLSFNAATLTFSGTPANADVGPVTITVTATDLSGATTSDSFVLTVTNTNNAPTVAAPIADQGATEGATFSFTFPAGTFTDADASDSLSYTTSALPSWLSFDAGTRTFSGTPTNADVGPVTITVTATDLSGAQASDSFVLTVANTNNAPTVASAIADQGATEDSLFSFTFPAGTFADADTGDSLSYTTSALPGWLSFNAGTRTFSGTPTNADVGNTTITVTATDLSGATTSDSFVLTVTNTNNAPTVAAPIADQGATEDAVFSFSFPADTFADVDTGDSLSYTTNALPGWLSFDAGTRTFSGTPSNADVGNTTITVTATDGSGAQVSDSFVLTVTNTNDAPTVAAPSADQSATEDVAFSFTFPAGTFADADAGDSLSYTTSALPSWLSFNAGTRTFSGTPTNADVGNTTITVTATDGSGAQASDSFVLTVSNTNNAPTVAAPIADQSATEDAAFSFTFPAGTFTDADASDSLSYTTSLLPGWLSFNAGTRTFSGTPANADVGPVTITVTATDLSGATTSDSFVLTVANTNDAPTVAAPIADQSATEDSLFSFTFPAGTFTDADASDGLSYTTSALPGWLSFNAATRTFSGTPANADVGPVTITVTATDLSGATASDSFVLTVANINDAPTVASAIADQDATEDAAFSFTFPAGTFADEDAGDSLSYTTSALPSWLSFDAGTRTFSGTPANADVGSTTITVTATDLSGAQVSDSFVLTVANTNDAPTVAAPIVDQDATEDAAFSFTFPAGTFADADAGDSLSYTTSALPGWLSFNAATRTFSGTPTNADVGPVTITVTATDLSGATASDSFVLTVANTNDAPTVTAPIADQSATEDVAFSFMLPPGTFADADTGDSLSYTTSALPGWLSFNAGTRTFSGTPTNADVGNTTITVTATDGSGAQASDSFVLTVANTNDAPTVAAPIVDQDATEDAAFSFTFPADTFADADASDSLSYTTSALPNWLSFNAGTRTFSGTPTNADVGPVTITVTATDLSGATASDSFVLTVANTNNAPTVAAPIADQDATEDAAFSFTLPPGTFADADAGDSLSYTTSALPGWLSFNVATRTFSGTPANADVGNTTITVTATDLSGATSSDSFALTVANTNDAPTVATSIADQGATEDAVFSFSFPADTFADADTGDSLSYTTSALPSWLSFNAGTRTFSGTPSNAGVGNTTITVTATDLSGATASDSFVLTVANTNNAPTVAAPIADQSATEDVAFSFTLPPGTFADADTGDSLSYTTSALPSWLSFDAGTRTLSGTPTNADVGPVTITVTATDLSGATASDSFVLTMNNTNDPPIALADTVITAEDTPLSFDPVANDIDPDGDVLTLASVTQGAHGLVSLVGGAILYTPDADFNGADSFTYTISDGQGGSTTATVSVTVTPVNDMPQAADDAMSVAEDEVLAGSVAANDSPSGDGGNVWRVVAGPSHGSLVLAGDGGFRYTPAPDFHGADGFTYTLTDADGDSVTATAAIVVTLVNDAPEMIGGASVALHIAENTTAVATLGATDADMPAQVLRYGIVGGADQALFSVDAVTGVLRFTAPPDHDAPADSDRNNVYELIVEVSDGIATASQTLAITVDNRNEMPRGSDGRIGMDEDGSYRFTLGDFGFHDDLDSPANSLAAVQLVALPGPGVLQLAGRGVAAGEWVAAGDIAAGRLSYQPAPDANGSGYASLLFRVRDNGGTAGGGIDTEAGTHTLSIDVAAVNDAPVISLVAFELPPGTGVVLGAGSIVVSDVDSSLATLEYVVEVASAGHFERVGAPGQAILGFSQADLLAGRVVFVRDLAEATPVVVLHARDAQAGSSAVTATITVQESAPGGGAGPVLTPTEPPASTSMPPEPPVRSVTSPEPPASTATPVVTKPAEAEKITKTPTTINRPGLPDGLAPEINPVSPGDGPLTLARDAAGNTDPASRTRNQTVGGTLRFDRAPVRLSLDGGLDGPLLDFMLRGDGLVSTSTGTSAGLRGADSNLREGLQGKDGEVDVRVVLQAIELTGVALSVGAVWWATRAGALVASLLVSVPAWRSFDPLMVLGPEDEGDRDWAGVMDDQAVRDEMGIAGVFDAKIGEARS